MASMQAGRPGGGFESQLGELVPDGTPAPRPKRIYRSWAPTMVRAVAIIRGMGTAVTLRQLFYRLVAEQLTRNVQGDYCALSKQYRDALLDDDTVPELIDRGREITRYSMWKSPADALRDAADCYRIDRTVGQPWSIYLVVEKDGSVTQLAAWFADLGIPIVALKGYASKSFCDAVRRDVLAGPERPSLLLYVGDYDGSGDDLERSFLERTACWAVTNRVTLTEDQISTHGTFPSARARTRIPALRSGRRATAARTSRLRWTR